MKSMLLCFPEMKKKKKKNMLGKNKSKNVYAIENSILSTLGRGENNWERRTSYTILVVYHPEDFNVLHKTVNINGYPFSHWKIDEK